VLATDQAPGTSVNDQSGTASGCPDADWRVWHAYSSRVPESSLEIVRTLFERICEAIQARELEWSAYRDVQTIGFKSTAEGSFKIAIHVGAGPRPQDRVSNPPSFLVHPDPPVQLETNPFPELLTFWDDRFNAQGWNVFSERRIPDMGIAVELALEHGRA
jgi:hypothetical protein